MTGSRPPWLPLAAAAVATALFLGLGLWQLDRARAKGEWMAVLERGASAPIVPLPVEAERFEALAFRRVEASGRLRGARQFLLDNRIHRGRPGFDVLVPLVRGNGDTILVDRGWVPATPQRRPARPIRLRPPAEMPARGRLWLPEPGFALGPALAPGNNDWPRLATRIDYEAMGAALGVELLPAVIRLEASIPWALEPRPLQPRFGPMRHVGYAVQWFALAAAVVVISVLLWRRRRKGL